MHSPTLKHSYLEHTTARHAHFLRRYSEFFQICRTAASWRTTSPWYSMWILRDRFSAKPLQCAPFSTRDPCWGVVQLVGHLTVNEDGEGSNPSAPAKLTDFTATYFFPFLPKSPFLPIELIYEPGRAILHCCALLISENVSINGKRQTRIAVPQLLLHESR